MTQITDKLAARIATMESAGLVKAIRELNKSWDAYTPEEREIRSRLLAEYERRSSGERLDALMDDLDQALVAEALRLEGEPPYRDDFVPADFETSDPEAARRERLGRAMLFPGDVMGAPSMAEARRRADAADRLPRRRFLARAK